MFSASAGIFSARKRNSNSASATASPAKSSRPRNCGRWSRPSHRAWPAACSTRESGHCTDPAALSAALFSAYRQAGGEVHRSAVKQLQPSSQGVRIVTENGEAVVDEVVVAAGIWSPKLVKPFGVRPMLAAERGYHLMLTKPDVTLRRPIGAGDDKFIITPMAKGIRLAGTAEFANVNAPADYRRSDILLGMAQDGCFPRWTARPRRHDGWARAPRHRIPCPWSGRTPKNPRIICAYGHAHLGLTLGAVTAEMVSDIVGGRTKGVEALRPDRF